MCPDQIDGRSLTDEERACWQARFGHPSFFRVEGAIQGSRAAIRQADDAVRQLRAAYAGGSP